MRPTRIRTRRGAFSHPRDQRDAKRESPRRQRRCGIGWGCRKCPSPRAQGTSEHRSGSCARQQRGPVTGTRNHFHC